MVFIETELGGVFIVRPDRFTDERGFFADVWHRSEFEKHGLSAVFVQCSISFNLKAGTLRGMHYQVAPYAQPKLVRCTAGSIYDVAIDLRAGSPTFLKWVGVKLTADNRDMLYIPEDMAHGFQTLEDDTEVCYQVGGAYHPPSARGVRWDDPAFGIRWPLPVSAIASRDAHLPDFGGSA